MKVVDKILTPTLFQVFILVLTAFMQIPFVHYAYGGYVKYALAFGILVCVWLLFRKELLFVIKDKANIAALCFVLLYSITIFLNRDNCFMDNIKQLIYMLVFFLIVFFVRKDNSKIVSIVVVLLTFILSFVSFLTDTLRVFEWYELNGIYYIGNYYGLRLWGLYNPNTCGGIAVISIIASLYVLFGERSLKKIVRIFANIVLIINIVLQYIVMVLSASRGAYYSFLITITVVVFIAIIKNPRKDSMSAILRTFIAFILCFITIFCVVISSDLIQENSERLCLVSDVDASNPELDTRFENAIEEVLKKYATESSAFAGFIRGQTLTVGNSLSEAIGGRDVTNSTGRTDLWKAGFKAFLDKPLFGWTREGLVNPVVNYAEAYAQSVPGGGLHNIYLTILCSSGVLGLICFLVLLGIVLVRFLKKLLNEEKIDMALLFSFAMCLYFFVSELVECRILYTVSFYNIVFWAYFGYLNYFSKKEITGLYEEKNFDKE